MLTIDKITEIFCITDDFCQNFDVEFIKNKRNECQRQCLCADRRVNIGKVWQAFKDFVKNTFSSE